MVSYSCIIYTKAAGSKNKFSQRQKQKRQRELYIHLQATSLADLGGKANLLAIPVGVSRALDLLAQSADSNVLPVLDALHLGIELTGGAVRSHRALDVFVDGGTLLEETDRVVVAADAVVGVLHRLRDFLVGVHDQSRLLSEC